MHKEPCKIVAVEHLTLDGVYQAPARADEDRREGFRSGGWAAAASNDPNIQQAIGRHMGGGWSLLAGSTTYEDLHEGWQLRQPGSPMTKALREAQKFVVSRKADYRLSWENSTLLAGEAAQTVARLKKEHDKTLIIFGSGILVRALLQHRLLDALVLIVHPLVLGEGRRLFDHQARVRLELTDEFATDAGVVVTSYRPVSE